MVPNAEEWAAIQQGRKMQAKGKTLREISAAWKASGLPEMDAKTISRILKGAKKFSAR
jgi:hypothetical protein